MTERTCHFICSLSAIEALGGFLSPSLGNGKRFREFVERYFPDPYPSQAGALWKLRNDAVHVFLTGPYNLMHHSGHLHLTQDKDGLTILNAEDFYALSYSPPNDTSIPLRVTRARRLVGFFRQCLSYAFCSGSLHQSQAVRADKVSPCCFAKGVDLTSVPFDIFLVQRVHSRAARPNKKTSSMALSRIVRNPLRMPASTLKRRIAARFCRS